MYGGKGLPKHKRKGHLYEYGVDLRGVGGVSPSGVAKDFGGPLAGRALARKL